MVIGWLQQEPEDGLLEGASAWARVEAAQRLKRLPCLLVPQPAHAETPQVATVRLRKGSLAKLSLTRGPASLQLLLDPRTVRALYSTSTKSSRRKTSRK